MQKKSLILLLVGWALAPILMTSLSANLPGVGSMKNTISNARTAERRHVLPDGPDMWEVEGIGELVRIVPIVERIAIIKIHILKWSGRN